MSASPDKDATIHQARPVGRDRPNARGTATRELILITAEQLFAERGIAAVPIRDIAVSAGQKNTMAVQYHFGDKENLVREVAAFRARFVSDMQADLVADLLSGRQPPSVADFVRSFVMPLAGNLHQENHYIPFLHRYMIERGGYAGLENSVPPGTATVLNKILHRLLPDHPDEVLTERWQIGWACAVSTLARYQAGLKSGTLPAPLDQLLDDLIRFLTGGLEAAP